MFAETVVADHTVVLALIAALGSFFTSIVGIVALWIKTAADAKVAKVANDVAVNTSIKAGDKMQEIHLLVNSRQALMDAKQLEQEKRLLDLTKELAEIKAQQMASTITTQILAVQPKADVKEAFDSGKANLPVPPEPKAGP